MYMYVSLEEFIKKNAEQGHKKSDYKDERNDLIPKYNKKTKTKQKLALRAAAVDGRGAVKSSRSESQVTT